MQTVSIAENPPPPPPHTHTHTKVGEEDKVFENNIFIL